MFEGPWEVYGGVICYRINAKGGIHGDLAHPERLPGRRLRISLRATLQIIYRAARTSGEIFCILERVCNPVTSLSIYRGKSKNLKDNLRIATGLVQTIGHQPPNGKMEKPNARLGSLYKRRFLSTGIIL